MAINYQIMKKIIFLGSLLLILSGCASVDSSQVSQTPPPPSSNPPPAVSCPDGEYTCACATGSYCLKKGAMCINPSSPCPASTVTYLVSAENPDKYCDGVNMDSEGFRKTITVEKTAQLPDANSTEMQKIKSIINLATTGMCQTVLSQVDISVTDGTVYIPPLEGWAGMSITMCSCKPEVEVNLLNISGINKVVWQ